MLLSLAYEVCMVETVVDDSKENQGGAYNFLTDARTRKLGADANDDEPELAINGSVSEHASSWRAWCRTVFTPPFVSSFTPTIIDNTVAMEDPMILHRIIRQIAAWAVYSFFTELRVIGGENVPRDGPLITTATHHNMMLDPAVLSSGFPYGRMQHYWSKASLFKNPILRYILISTGNVPVERKASDRRKLFQGTFDALARSAAIALFPEGTSYTEPRIMQVKDGAAWAALEYTKWALEQPERAARSPVAIVPAAIVYTNKSKYRSSAILQFGRPITMEPYIGQFLALGEGESRAAVKRLTHEIEMQLIEMTINAPDWGTLYASRMARDLLWADESSLPLDEFILVSQTLVDLFSSSDATPNFKVVKRRLLEYYSLLQSTQLTNAVLSSLPLPKTLDPNRPTPIPSRLLTLSVLIRDTLSCLFVLPFFVVPLAIHLPTYVIGKLGARLAEDEEETQAQNKVVLGLLFLMLCYPAAFFMLWALLWYSRVGAIASFTLVTMIAIYHTQAVGDAYKRLKRVEAAWRVLIGVWTPKRWEYSLSALEQYTRPSVPPPNPWIKSSRPTTPKPDASAESNFTTVPSPVALDDKLSSAPLAPTEPAATTPVKRKRRPRSGRVMRHVLRARAEAALALAAFFDALERSPPGHRVRASAHLARQFGGGIDETLDIDISNGPAGWRTAREVVSFLKARGARVNSLGKSIEGEWAMAGSDGEVSSAWESEMETPSRT
ncbi:hypothetical protein K488DRAFT_89590 [Vararia minispora EC-137]|uniref:Uncharacterized protein n=1 Tax=Vararia minispora EC-137 TaxID=1314806 RepID=A0ACB8QA02_9AGAM|nr:hypothetical protein K488DRAFT_89590 [Vararia minispora EC-137]